MGSRGPWGATAGPQGDAKSHLKARWVCYSAALTRGKLMVGRTARRLYFAMVLSLGGLGVHSRAEKLARQACEDDLPECRDSVRQRIATEKAITITAPWVALCIILLGAARFSRMREQKRRKKQEELARHHVRASVRDTKTKIRDAETSAADDDSQDDGFGMGPAGKPRR